MPSYDYRCAKCGHLFEAVQSIHDSTLTECPVCKGTLNRIIGKNVGISFKGSGFYVTDSGAKPASVSKPDSVSKPASVSKSAES